MRTIRVNITPDDRHQWHCHTQIESWDPNSHQWRWLTLHEWQQPAKPGIDDELARQGLAPASTLNPKGATTCRIVDSTALLRHIIQRRTQLAEAAADFETLTHNMAAQLSRSEDPKLRIGATELAKGLAFTRVRVYQMASAIIDSMKNHRATAISDPQRLTAAEIEALSASDSQAS